MSTTPTAVLETTQAASVGIIGGADGPTAIFVTGSEELNIESIKSLLDGFDPATILPDLSKVFDSLAPLCRFAVMVGPVVLLLLGLSYLFLSPKEANHYLGYRCYFGMGSVEAWRFTQRLGGMVWAGLGLVLTIVMTIVSLGFSGKEIMDIISSGVTCLVWEVVLVGLSCLGINILVAKRYDRNGELREK